MPCFFYIFYCFVFNTFIFITALKFSASSLQKLLTSLFALYILSTKIRRFLFEIGLITSLRSGWHAGLFFMSSFFLVASLYTFLLLFTHIAMLFRNLFLLTLCLKDIIAMFLVKRVDLFFISCIMLLSVGRYAN